METKFKHAAYDPKVGVVISEIKALEPKQQRHAIILLNIFYAVDVGSKALLPEDRIIKGAAKFGIETGLIKHYLRTENIENKILGAIEALSEKRSISLKSLDHYMEIRRSQMPESEGKDKDQEYTAALWKLYLIIDKAKDEEKLGSLARDLPKSELYQRVMQLEDRKVVSSIALTSSLLAYYDANILTYKKMEKYRYVHPEMIMNEIAAQWAENKVAYDTARIADPQTLEIASRLILQNDKTANTLSMLIADEDFGVKNNRIAYAALKEISRNVAWTPK